MAILKLTLLGAFEVRDGSGREVPISARKNRGLLAVLGLAPSVSREQMAGLLWSDRGDAQSRNSLRQALASLRKDLAEIDPSPLANDDEKISLDHHAVDVDVVAFRGLGGRDDPESLRRALDLYRGELLADTIIGDPAFEEWARAERARLHDLAVSAAERLWVTENGQARVMLAKRLVELEPLKEQSHLSLMQSYVDIGEEGLALQHYSECNALLKAELGIKPGKEIESLRRTIINGVSQTEKAKSGSIPENNDLKTTPAPIDKPSIAVLPFLNLSGDPQQEYFADGIVEEIIIALSRMPSLFVVARNSSFSYKGRSIDVRQVGQELGVRYVLEGSVRKADERVRIGGQLIDASSGTNLWANRFDGKLEDIFELQDQVTAAVVGEIAPRLQQAEIERMKRKPTESLDAYDYFLRGMAGLHKWTREGNDEALLNFYRAIALDPQYAAAHGLAARTYTARNAGGWMSDTAQEVREAKRLARRAVELGPDDPIALCTGGFVLSQLCGEIKDGDALVELALSLNPNLAWAWLFSGWIKATLGETDIAIDHINRAQRLSPQDPQVGIQSARAFAHFVAGRYEDALAATEAVMRRRSNYLLPNVLVVVCAAHLGRSDMLGPAMQRLTQDAPGYRISRPGLVRPMRPQDQMRRDEGLRIAGIPE
jgi:TolB-like protein/Tfp pilus assembly protein PilF